MATLPVFLLLVGAIVLAVTTMSMAPVRTAPRRRHDVPPIQVRTIQGRRRRVPTGRPAPVALPPGALSSGRGSLAASQSRQRSAHGSQAPHRQLPRASDGRVRHDPVSEATATIEYLLDADPLRIANLMTAWIHEDTGTARS